MNAWWDPQTGTLIGAIGGSAIGILGAILGTAAGIFAPRGKAKGFVMGLLVLMLAIGGVASLAGIVAIIDAQPYAVWYPLILGGAITLVASLSCTPAVMARYREAEARRLQSESFRRG
ncbi:MAG: hypothetical protein JNM07_09350 [Phycisphaerae bacterium]|nr:hypothetical protein [Phycisphaerae bacterium]